MRDRLDEQALHEALVTSGSPWAGLEVHAELGSTNARAVRAGAAWQVVVADHQSAGRGRMGRSWQTPPGTSVTVSAVLPAVPGAPGWVPLLAGLAVARALERLAGVHAALKWPNDVLVAEDGWRKASGILCEAHGDVVVVGMGVNVDQQREELPVDTATSLRLCGALGVRREDVVVACLEELAALHGSLAQGGAVLEAARAAYRSACRTLGRQVELQLAGGGRRLVAALAVDDDGRLVVRGPGGEYAVAAGDVVHARGPAPTGEGPAAGAPGRHGMI
jgi:BirA family biotin operon repressor/biotin-[acetyl-CoA-carboxylase] ligase